MILKELEHKSCVSEEDLSELKADMEAVRMNLILANGRVKKNTDSLKELQEIVEGLSGQPMTSSAPQKASIDLEMLKGHFASLDSFTELERRVQACEKTDNNHDQVLGNHEDRLSNLERQFE